MLLRYRTVIAVFQGIVRLLRKLSIGSQGIPPYISNALRRRGVWQKVKSKFSQVIVIESYPTRTATRFPHKFKSNYNKLIYIANLAKISTMHSDTSYAFFSWNLTRFVECFVEFLLTIRQRCMLSQNGETLRQQIPFFPFLYKSSHDVTLQ